MKLAISNIAWSPESAKDITKTLRPSGVEGLVIAPTMVWPNAPDVEAQDAIRYRQEMEDAGLAIVGLQSLVFGRDDVGLFSTNADRTRLSELLKRHAGLAENLGARALIFGSPGLRKANGHSTLEMMEVAAGVFRDVAESTGNSGVKLAIEPLSGYGNEFVTNARQGIDLVNFVDRPYGFGLHLDSAALAGAGDTVEDIARAVRSVGITSFDASAPNLLPPSTEDTVPHTVYADALANAGYQSFVSIEMRGPHTLERIREEIGNIQDLYKL